MLRRGRALGNVAKSAVLVALTAVSAQIAIPIPPVPLTLQVFAVLLAGAVGGSSLGAISMLIYILIGLIGLPVFSGFSGGLHSIFLPSFGYLLGFPISAVICGLFEPKGNFFRRSPLIFLVGVLPIYFTGMLYLYFFAPMILGKSLSIGQLLVVGFAPFILPDIGKAVLAWAIAVRLRRR